jgi:hypothetical protein
MGELTTQLRIYLLWDINRVTQAKQGIWRLYGKSLPANSESQSPSKCFCRNALRPKWNVWRAVCRWMIARELNTPK